MNLVLKGKRAVLVALFLMIGCNQSEATVPTVSQSKVTAITVAIEKASPGVVSIYRNQEIAQINRWTGRLKSLKPIQSSGSGFIISKDGYILTNAHNIITEIRNPSVLTTDTKIDVVLPGGDHYAASIVGVDSRSDIALLKIQGEDFQHCELGDSDEIIEAKNGKEAVEIYKDQSPDICFMDLTMPIMDGFEAVKQICEYDKDAKIIIVSADIQEASMKRAKENGAIGFIKKPISEENLATMLNKSGLI